jgi:CarboxypepD_reg-like domain/TonB-dependent Receptor Plug Domain
MKIKHLLFFILGGLPWLSQAQTLLNGQIVDEKKKPLAGANVFVVGTYDGASSDASGQFKFTTYEKGALKIQVSFVGFETFTQDFAKPSDVPTNWIIRLSEKASELNTVTISAGAFEASDEKKITMLKPLDIVTTAGANADITAVMQLLPGANRVGESEGLFIRGGSAQESKVVIDGMIVQNPFNSSVPDMQQRGRFDPFQFKGTSFATGGYSAQYGQALSGVLLLTTTDKAAEEGWALGANLALANAGYTWVGEKSSLRLAGSYGNLWPLFRLIRQNVDWQKEPEFWGSSLTYRLKTSATGLLKAQAQWSSNDLAMRFPNAANNLERTLFSLQNKNFYTNTTYQDFLDKKNTNWQLNLGASWSYNNDRVLVEGQDFGRSDTRWQLRGTVGYFLKKNNKVLAGVEGHSAWFQSIVNTQAFELNDRYGAAFAEAELYLNRNLAIKPGLRVEHNTLINRGNLASRFSIAYKTGQYSQLSVASGIFWQTPVNNYLFLNRNLDFERADHWVLNYQLIKNDRTLRTEVFYKKYSNLVKEITGQPFDANPNRFPNGRTNNAGQGYAQGFDVFFRDRKTFKSADIWLTYSFVDTQRDFANYPVEAMPTFASNHNASAVFKYFLGKPQMSLSMTYTFTSGRPYFNPNNPVFMADRTPPVHLVNFSGAYLTRIAKHFTIIYFSSDNLLNALPIFGYRYSADGRTRTPVNPAQGRSFFIGFIINISKKNELSDTMKQDVMK